MIAEKLRDLSHWTTDDGQDLVMVADVLELIREDFEVMRQEIEQAKIGCEQQMRPATLEERQGEEEYIDSISQPTGVNFNDLLKHDEEEWIDECFDKLYNAPTVEYKPQEEEKNICDSCVNTACIFDSHVKRQKCDFYKPQPKTGHWIRQDNTKEPLYGWYFCSECNSVIGDKPKFCSNCGARMEDKE